MTATTNLYSPSCRICGLPFESHDSRTHTFMYTTDAEATARLAVINIDDNAEGYCFRSGMALGTYAVFSNAGYFAGSWIEARQLLAAPAPTVAAPRIAAPTITQDEIDAVCCAIQFALTVAKDYFKDCRFEGYTVEDLEAKAHQQRLCARFSTRYGQRHLSTQLKAFAAELEALRWMLDYGTAEDLATLKAENQEANAGNPGITPTRYAAHPTTTQTPAGTTPK